MTFLKCFTRFNHYVQLSKGPRRFLSGVNFQVSVSYFFFFFVSDAAAKYVRMFVPSRPVPGANVIKLFFLRNLRIFAMS
jgi:hypothetical protein